MKFGKQLLKAASLSKSVCREEDWMDYKLLKKFLKTNLRSESLPSSPKGGERKSLSPVPDQLENVADEKAFFKAAVQELSKVNRCYRRLEIELVPLARQLKSEFNQYMNQRAAAKEEITNEMTETLIKKLQHLHMKLLGLQNYAVLNYCGFSKIIKKHDKFTNFKTREKFMLNKVNCASFSDHNFVKMALREVERCFQYFIETTDDAHITKPDSLKRKKGGSDESNIRNIITSHQSGMDRLRSLANIVCEKSGDDKEVEKEPEKEKTIARSPKRVKETTVNCR